MVKTFKKINYKVKLSVLDSRTIRKEFRNLHRIICHCIVQIKDI